MKISLYSSLFNIKKCKFDYKRHLEVFTKFADEVVISTIEDQDDSWGILLEEAAHNDKIKVVLTEFVPHTPLFDGQMKNASLQECTGDILVQCDFDECPSMDNLDMWVQLWGMLFTEDKFQAAFVPVINLYKDVNHFSDIGAKWYVHKRGLFRGAVDFARREDGTIDTKKSDTCELIDKDGKLVPTLRYFDLGQFKTWEEAIGFVKQQRLPVIYHYGYVDLDRRVEINKEFWAGQWSAEEGSNVKLPESVGEIQKDYIEHGLNLPL